MSIQPPQTPLVFTPDWVERQRRRYSKHPAHARPRRYNLWVADDLQWIRNRIEGWVASLAPEEQEGVIPRLRDPGNFQQAYNELAVGDSLRAQGLQLAYEPELNGQTPDWLVCHPEKACRFILEVLSSNPSEDRVARDNDWDAFRLRLEALPGNALLWIQKPDPDDDAHMVAAAPTVARQKQIVGEVARWLKEGAVEGYGLSFDGTVIRYLGQGEEGVKCSLGFVPFWVDGEPLKEAIKGKASKYRVLTESLQLPLVVSVVPDFRTGRGLDEAVDAALGRLQHQLVLAPEEEDYRERCYREANGLFAQYLNLSAVMVSELGFSGMTHQVLRNPSATLPLPEGVIVESRKEKAL